MIGNFLVRKSEKYSHSRKHAMAVISLSVILLHIEISTVNNFMKELIDPFKSLTSLRIAEGGRGGGGLLIIIANEKGQSSNQN